MLSTRHSMFTVVLLIFVTAPTAFADPPTKQRRVLYNFDGDSCMFTRAGGKGPVAITVDDVNRLIEEVAYDGSRVDTVLVCVNAQVTYYPTKVGTMRGTLSTPDEQAKWPASEKQRFQNLQAFFEKGVDPYAIMLAQTKRRGREALLTFRMNDDHGNDFLRTQFLVDYPDWRLGTEQYRGKGAMDFGRDEVRDYTFRLIEEAVRRYDCDGIELDFNRFPTFFKDGSTEERVAKMNSLVERVHKMLDDVGRQRSRRLVLAVRVPSNYGRTPPTPETARQLGCDVPAWVKHGWVDFVAVSEFLLERGDLPIGLWKQAITTVPVYGGIECTKGSGQKNLTADEYRHSAAELVKASADGVYLFNFFTSREGGEVAYEPPFEVLRDLVPAKVGFRDESGLERPDVEFKIFQFPADKIPRIDGNADDWSIVPDSYAIGSDQLRETVVGIGDKRDPSNLDVKVKVGWVNGQNHLYFLYEAYDNYWDFAREDLHNDIFEVVIDGDLSGGKCEFVLFQGLFLVSSDSEPGVAYNAFGSCRAEWRTIMTVRQPRLSKEEHARRGMMIYEQQVRPHVEAGNKGRIVAIDIDTGTFEVADDTLAACERVLARHPDAQIWCLRIGHRAVHRFGPRV